MRKRKGLWVAIGGGLRADKVAASIERNGTFSTTVTASEVGPRAVELAVVSLHGTEIDYVAISHAGRDVATDQKTIVISNAVALEPLSVDELRRKLPSAFAAHFGPPSIGEWRVPPRLWEEILNAVNAMRPEVRDRVAELTQTIAEAAIPRGRTEGGLGVLERDAVAVALQTWRDRTFRVKVLRSAATERAAPTAPFLARLKSVSVGEDLLIAQDQARFPGMEVAQRSAVASAAFAGDDEYLTILNCNRQPLERTLGVDLLYYNHRYDSFVLVQYKRMTAGTDGGVAEYRPDSDKSHAKELRRMVKTNKRLRELGAPDAGDISAFRLSGQPFFMKLCESKARPALDAGMVSGMYVPLGLWRRLLKSESVRGPRGGTRITWDTCKRRFNNSEFTSLLRHGWIGSAAGRSRVLSQIVEEVLDGGRMLVYAATSAAPESKDLRRDERGRFAADDDPAGAL